MAIDHCDWEPGACKENHVFLALFQELTGTKKLSNGETGKVTMHVRFCCICRTSRSVNASSVKENYDFQPYFLAMERQFNICLETDDYL